MAQQQAQPQKFIKTMECTEASGKDPCKITAVAMTMLGKQPLIGEEVQFYKNGITDGNSKFTSTDGRAVHTFEQLVRGEGYILEVALVTKPEKRFLRNISIPEKTQIKQTGPSELLINPVRNDNKLTLVIRVINAENKGVSGKRLTIIKGGVVIKPDPITDQDGEYQETTDLIPGQETNIQVYVAGFGKGFERTFRGKVGS